MIDQVPIAIQTLDNFCIDEKIRHINVLKLDTQGGEYGIVQGAQKLLARRAIDVIMTEFFFIPHYEDAPLLNQIWTALLLHGYHLFDLFQGPHGADGQARYGDAIFVSPNFRSRFLGAAHRLSGQCEASWTNLFRSFKSAIANS